MKFQVISDIHLDFYEPDSVFVVLDREIPYVKDVDGIIIAGDLWEWRNAIPSVIEYFSDMYDNFIYVTGNHDYWGSTKEHVDEQYTELSDKISNFHFLNKSSVEINGIKFSGGTLWYPISQSKDFMFHFSDFHHVYHLKDWVEREFNDTLQYFHKEDPDVVITHHMPILDATPERFEGSELNCFFCTDCTKDIKKLKNLKAWVCGHTHDPYFGEVDGKKIVINPLGYPNEDCDPKGLFDPSYVLEVDEKEI
jgi:predicted phosphodiesterase